MIKRLLGWRVGHLVGWFLSLLVFPNVALPCLDLSWLPLDSLKVFLFPFSPAWLQNHEELLKAFEEGPTHRTNKNPPKIKTKNPAKVFLQDFPG